MHRNCYMCIAPYICAPATVHLTSYLTEKWQVAVARSAIITKSLIKWP